MNTPLTEPTASASPCGLTLWDHYAGHIIGGFAANDMMAAGWPDGKMAIAASEVADAMIAERAKRHPKQDNQSTAALNSDVLKVVRAIDPRNSDAVYALRRVQIALQNAKLI